VRAINTAGQASRVGQQHPLRRLIAIEGLAIASRTG